MVVQNYTIIIDDVPDDTTFLIRHQEILFPLRLPLLFQYRGTSYRPVP